MGDILTGTPPGLTYDHEMVRQAWLVVWAIASGALAIILGWMGLSFIVQEHLGRHQSGWREMVPRLVLGLTAAASSLWWCALVIDVADAVSGFIAASLNVTPGDLLRAPLFALLAAVQTASTGWPSASPCSTWSSLHRPLPAGPDGAAPGPDRHPAGVGPHRVGWDSAPHGGLGEALAAALHDHGVPAGGAVNRIGTGLGFLGEFAAIAEFEPVQDLVWKLLMAIAFVYLATRVPAMLGNHVTFDAWLHTLYFGMSLPGSMMRSARSIGLIAGGAAGGPPGMAAAVASAGTGLASSAVSGLIASILEVPGQRGTRPAPLRRPERSGETSVSSVLQKSLPPEGGKDLLDTL